MVQIEAIVRQGDNDAGITEGDVPGQVILYQGVMVLVHKSGVIGHQFPGIE